MSEVQTLARGLQILELLADTDGGLSTTELAEQLGIDKSGISRLMNTLVKYRFVDRDGQTRRYYLGVHVHDLGQRAGQHADLRDLVAPYLDQLATQTSENAHVAVHTQGQALTIADVPSTEPLRVVSEAGRRMPLHCSAVGKCLLAFAEIPTPLAYPKFTNQTLVDAKLIKLQLEQIRHQGYALDDEELTLGVRGISVPIRNREGRAIAALGISGPTVRLTLEKVDEFAMLLKNTAVKISTELGFTPL